MARRLAPGFRFHPTAVELTKYYLKRKVMGRHFPPEAVAAIPEVEIYKFAPWDLPDKSRLRSKDLMWYFFCPREKKYGKGGRMNRATDFGFWKTTGRDRPVVDGGKTVGMRRSLIFHRREPELKRTDWVMHEYRLEDKEDKDLSGFAQDAFVICMIFQKKGPGPNNGAQYGAPFNEEEWYSDEDVIDFSHGVPVGGVSASAFLPPHNQSSSIDVGPSDAAEGLFIRSTSNSDPSQVVQFAANGISGISGDNLVGDVSVQGAVDPYMDGISFCDIPDSTAQTQNQIVADLNDANEDDIFEGLGDLDGGTILSMLGFGHEITGQPEQKAECQFSSNECLEMNDLESPLDQFNIEESYVEIDDLDSPLAPVNEACQYEGAANSNTVSAVDCYGTSGSFSFASTLCGDEQHATGFPVNPTGQSFPNLSQEPQLEQNGSVFFEENGVGNWTNHGDIGQHGTYCAPDYSGYNLGVERVISRGT